MMQRQQRSLLPFFANNATPENKNGVLERKGSSVCSEERLSRAQTLHLQESSESNLEVLHNKSLRRSSQCFLKAGGLDRSLLSSRDGTSSLRALHALDCRPSIPGIKRIREDHEDPSQDDPCASQLLKRKRLVEALGDGELHHGSWEEAKAKFEWLIPSKFRDGKGRKPGAPYFDRRTLQIPADVLNKMSASQKQYWATKCQYMDTVLFFKVGKFYELYELDAEIGHKELNWKMTVSGVGRCRQVGVPESGIEVAVQKLLDRGYKVGRMEQIETTEQAKAKRGPGAMVQRKLTHVLTPSTRMDENMKAEAVHLLALREEPNHVSNSCSVNGSIEKTIFGFAFVDAAAGRFYVGSLHDDDSRSTLGALLTQVAPRELLYELGGLSDETMKALKRCSCQGLFPLELTPLQPNVEFLEASAAVNVIQSRGYFKESLDNESQCSTAHVNKWLEVLKQLNDFNPAAIALGALALHLCRIKLDEGLLKYGLISIYEVYKGSLRLDGQTLSNLEIFKNNADGGKRGTLMSFLDNCSTPFGKRLLRKWMCHPLQRIEEINDRLDAVEELRRHPDLVRILRSGLRLLPDLERLVARVRGCLGSSDVPRIPIVWNRFQKQKVKAFCAAVKGLLCGFDLLKSVHIGDREGSIHSHLLQAMPNLDGMNKEYALLYTIVSDIQKWLSRSNLQELELDERDTQQLNHLLMLFNKKSRSWSLVIDNLSQVDVLMSFSVSTDGTHGPTCRPMFVSKHAPSKEGAVLKIKELWHPFASGGERGIYVRNDIELGSESNSCRGMLLTGPNMGGKSTLLRATCLLVIMAQLGCYVPAESCVLSPVDIIFTRLGASDRIMTGGSTFMVECMEASSVLRYATGNSLVILDELGRGTSTFDGYAIAYAVFRHLVDTVDCRLLFATHYHPLTKEFAAHPSVRLQHMSFAFQCTSGSKSLVVKQPFTSQGGRLAEPLELGQEDPGVVERCLVFLYKLASGASPESYGLHVASLAGIPSTIVRRAEQARNVIQSRLSSTFNSNAHRERFSHVHDQWLQTILANTNQNNSNCNSLDVDDAYDTLLCIWHEVQSYIAVGNLEL